jgi:hypothetical protein
MPQPSLYAGTWTVIGFVDTCTSMRGSRVHHDVPSFDLQPVVESCEIPFRAW